MTEIHSRARTTDPMKTATTRRPVRETEPPASPEAAPSASLHLSRDTQFRPSEPSLESLVQRVAALQTINRGLPPSNSGQAERRTLDTPLFGPEGLATPDEIEQGWIGNCEIAAAAIAIAAQNPRFFVERLSETPDGNIVLRTDAFAIGVDREVYWDPEIQQPYFGSDRETGTAWYPMLEKALAWKLGGYDRLDAHNEPFYLFDLMTGGALPAAMTDANYQTILKLHRKGHAVMAGTGTETGGGLFPTHGYAVLAMTDREVTLQNPYGKRSLMVERPLAPEPEGNGSAPDDGVFTLSRAQFMAHVDWMGVSRNSVR